MESMKKRSEIIAFYGVSDGTNITFRRMKGFTEISTSKNAKEYSRQYIDEEFEQADVVGYSPSMSYGFDYHSDNLVHEDILKITNGELLADDAVRTIIMADTTTGKAVKRDFAVIPDSEGGSTDAYTYSGTFKVKGDKVFGTAASVDDFLQTITFTAD